MDACILHSAKHAYRCPSQENLEQVHMPTTEFSLTALNFRGQTVIFLLSLELCLTYVLLLAPPRQYLEAEVLAHMDPRHATGARARLFACMCLRICCYGFLLWFPSILSSVECPVGYFITISGSITISNTFITAPCMPPVIYRVLFQLAVALEFPEFHRADMRE